MPVVKAGGRYLMKKLIIGVLVAGLLVLGSFGILAYNGYNSKMYSDSFINPYGSMNSMHSGVDMDSMHNSMVTRQGRSTMGGCGGMSSF